MSESPYNLLLFAKEHQKDLLREAEARRLHRTVQAQAKPSLYDRLCRFLSNANVRQEAHESLKQTELYELIALEGAMSEVELQASKISRCATGG